jgi:signal transduction histidine kinase
MGRVYLKNKMTDKYLIIIYILSTIGIFLFIRTNPDKLLLHVLYVLIWLFSFSIRNLLIYKIKSYEKYYIYTFILEFILFIYIGFTESPGIIRALVLISFSDFCIFKGLKKSIYFILSIILLNFIILNNSTGNLNTAIKNTINELPVYLIVSIISLLVKRIFSDTKLLENNLVKIKEREAKLLIAYDDLNNAYEKLEEASTLKERNRIANNIHDNVGHSLTTAIVNMEAGNLEFNKNPEKSIKKFETAERLIKKALNEIRSSVHILAGNFTGKDFEGILTEIISNTSKHTDIIIKYEIKLSSDINTNYQQFIISALKECLSNSIRHGNSTSFFFKLNTDNNKLNFLLQDNGIGCSEIKFGYGLSKIKEKVHALNGNIDISSDKEDGFEVSFSLPL